MCVLWCALVHRPQSRRHSHVWEGDIGLLVPSGVALGFLLGFYPELLSAKLKELRQEETGVQRRPGVSLSLPALRQQAETRGQHEGGSVWCFLFWFSAQISLTSFLLS